MGYDICLKCLKYTVFTVNFLFWLFGLGVLGVSIWLRFDPQTTTVVGAGENLEKYYTGVYILIAAGALMTLVGFIGCCGAYQESQCLLSMFFLFLLVIFGAEIGGATWAYTHKIQLKEFVDRSLRDTVQHEYGRNRPKTIAYDYIQNKFACCGGENAYDWNFSYYATGKEAPEIGIGETANKVPPSCCTPIALAKFGEHCGDSNFTQAIILNPKKDPLKKGLLTDKDIDNSISSNQNLVVQPLLNEMIYQRGCSQALEEYFRSNLDIIIGVALAVIIIQLLGLLLSILLCCYIRKSEIEMDEYK